MNTLFTYLNKPVYKHILFWIMVYSFYISVDRINYNDTQKLFFVKFIYLLIQMISAYSIVGIIIPNYKKNKNIVILIVSLLGVIVFANILYIIWQIIYYTPNDTASCWYRFQSKYGELPFIRKIWAWKKDATIISWEFLQPSLFLISFLWYEKNLKLSVTNEQKKIAELEALKNQLNPHFLFNTLNNLYSLAVEKSEKTPIVIEHLSDILDYILYRCNDKFVPLEKEVTLIENYLALEKIRYSNRVEVTFEKSIKKEAKIAPLVLLTFIENAFKHGVRQELKQAKIKINLSTYESEIVFKIENTKPITSTESGTKPLGLKNVRQQLELLYPNAHNLEIADNEERFFVILTIKKLNV